MGIAFRGRGSRSSDSSAATTTVDIPFGVKSRIRWSCDVGDMHRQHCRRIALSSSHMGIGFKEGFILLFDLCDLGEPTVFKPRSSSSQVSGIILTSSQLIFAVRAGHIYIVTIGGEMTQVYFGKKKKEEKLVDFNGDEKYWVGVYSRLRKKQSLYRVWDASDGRELLVEDIFYMEKPAWAKIIKLGDGEIMGIIGDMHNGIRAMEWDPRRLEVAEILPECLNLISMDVCGDNLLVLHEAGMMEVHWGAELGTTCTLDTDGEIACLNSSFVFMFARGVRRHWGLKVYSLGTRQLVYQAIEHWDGESTVAVANDDHLAF